MLLSADDPTGKALRIVWGCQPEVRVERGREAHVPTQNENRRGYAQGILAQGNKIFVCSMCRVAQKIKQEDLVEGIKKPARS